MDSLQKVNIMLVSKTTKKGKNTHLKMKLKGNIKKDIIKKYQKYISKTH